MIRRTSNISDRTLRAATSSTAGRPVRLVAAVALASFALLAWVTAAPAATPVTLVGPDLKGRQVTLQSLAEGQVSYFDAQRVYRTEPLDRLLQLRAIGAPARPAAATAPVGAGPAGDAGDAGAASRPASGMLDLTDGQRIAGRWAGTAPDGQGVLWEHPVLGKFTVSLDRVRSISFRGDSQTLAGNVSTTQPAGDRVALANGDVTRGFVSAITVKGVVVKTTGGQTVTLPFERVRSVQLGGPAAEPDRAAHQVTLRDGSRVLAVALTIGEDRLRMQPALRAAGPAAASGAEAGPAVTLPLDGVARIDLASPAGRLVSLAELPHTLSGGDPFGVAAPAVVRTEVIRLHAPATAVFTLPARAQRLAATAQLDADGALAVEAKAWADFELVLRAGDKEIGRWRISGEHPRTDMTVDLPASPTPESSFTLELVPGVNGPVLDRLRVVDAVVLVSPDNGAR